MAIGETTVDTLEVSEPDVVVVQGVYDNIIQILDNPRHATLWFECADDGEYPLENPSKNKSSRQSLGAKAMGTALRGGDLPQGFQLMTSFMPRGKGHTLGLEVYSEPNSIEITISFFDNAYYRLVIDRKDATNIILEGPFTDSEFYDLSSAIRHPATAEELLQFLKLFIASKR